MHRSPHLPQLFGFCSSPRLRSLVFHGGNSIVEKFYSTLIHHPEFRTFDEYAKSLSSPRAIVEWETDLVPFTIISLCPTLTRAQVLDFAQLVRPNPESWNHEFFGARRFALVNAQDGKFVITHVESTSAGGLDTQDLNVGSFFLT
jgi:hypothetical protein